MTFYEVRGRLLRRGPPVRAGISVDAWTGDGWIPFDNLDAVPRYGHRLNTAQALELLHETRERLKTAGRLSDEDPRVVLRARRNPQHRPDLYRSRSTARSRDGG